MDKMDKTSEKEIKESHECKHDSCSYNDHQDELDNPQPKVDIVKSTRSSSNPDAHRDMDGFDIDEELARLRKAIKNFSDDKVSFILEAISNIDEHLVRWGDLPKAWLHSNSITQKRRRFQNRY